MIPYRFCWEVLGRLGGGVLSVLPSWLTLFCGLRQSCEVGRDVLLLVGEGSSLWPWGLSVLVILMRVSIL